jgi:hypothetical protein
VTVTDVQEVLTHPQLKPPAGKTLKEWKEAVISKFPTFRKNTSVEIPHELAEELDVFKWAKDYWTEQYELAALKVREAMGEAQHATYQGKPVATRYRFWKDGYEVKGHFEDQLRKRA